MTLLPRTGLLATVLLLVAASWSPPAGAQARETESCVTCHLAIGDDRLVKPAKDFTQDIHGVKGFGCVACHGGDPTQPGLEAMDPAKGYIGKLQRAQIAQVCGRCHSDERFMKRYNPSIRVDQVADYATSVHGRRLKELGDAKVATCVSCHRPHSIRAASDPQSSVHPLRVADTCGGCHGDPKYMAPSRIATDQLERYKTSVHWKTMADKGDLSAPTCNDCHGNHGATPPGVSAVGAACGQCHAVMAELFAQSRHAKIFTQMGVPGCGVCHDNHGIQPASDELLGLGDKAVCVGCHAAEDPGGKAAVEMRRLVQAVRSETDRAHAILLQAEHAGMEVSQAQFDLNGAREALVKTRATVHAFSVEAVKKEAEAGLAIGAQAYGRGVRALDELQFRRKGLAVSVLIILAVMGGLVLKIRQLERRPATPPPQD
jgi:predicted CXXCH cytochrome family protein